MDAFSYLSVLISVILGFAVQQVLLGYRALILSRRRGLLAPANGLSCCDPDVL